MSIPILVTPTAPIFHLSRSLLAFRIMSTRILIHVFRLRLVLTWSLDCEDDENYCGVDPLAVDKEARSLLFKYMGDHYHDANVKDVGEPSGAGSVLSEWESTYGCGLFNDAFRPKPGIKLPSEFATEFQRLDEMNALKAVLRRTDSAFLFSEPEQSRCFGPKRLSPDTIAFADSLKDPADFKSPLSSKEFKQES